MSTMQDVLAAIEAQRRDFGLATDVLAKLYRDLKARLDGIETKARSAGGAPELAQRLDLIEGALARPGFGPVAPADRTPEEKAYNAWLRRGDKAEPDELKTLIVSSDPDGGYLATPTRSTELVRLINAASPLRRLAALTIIGGDGLVFPRQTGNMHAGWVGEISEAPESQPAYGQANVPVHRLAAYTEVSQKLLEDSVVDLAAELLREYGDQYALAEGQAFMTGNGITRPRGVLTYPDGTGDGRIERVPSGAAANLTADALITALHRLSQAARQNATWLMNGDTIAIVRKMKDTTGRYLWDSHPNAGIVNGQPETLLGRPVQQADDMPDVVPGALPVAVGDWRAAYRIVDRVGLSVIRDPYTKARNAIVCFTGYRRVGGDVASFGAVKLVEVRVS